MPVFFLNIKYLNFFNVYRKKILDFPHLIAGDFDSILPPTKYYFSNCGGVKFINLSDQNSTDLTKTLRLISNDCVSVL